MLVLGRSGGHLDLPRMREGGIQGGIFSVFTPSPGPDWHLVPREDGVFEIELAAPVAQIEAAAYATVAAGRLLALERDGYVRLARGVADLDLARTDNGRPAAVLHLEGAEALD